jgi:hypothetical protein
MSVPRHGIAERIVRGIRERALGGVLSRFRTANVTMFHIGRSGSTVLTDLLDQHPGLFWDGHDRYERLFQQFEARGISVTPGSVRHHDPIDILKPGRWRAGERIYAFDLKFYYLRCFGIELQRYIDRLRMIGFTHFIILERRNYLRKVLSSLVARASGNWHLNAGTQPELIKIRLDINDVGIDRERRGLLEFLRGYSEDFRHLREILGHHPNVLRLYFEDDISRQPLHAYRRTCELLGIQPRGVSIRYAKTTPFAMMDVVTNYREVEAALTGTEFEWMLLEERLAER